MTNLRRRLRRLAAGTIAGALALSTAPLMGVASAADDLPPVAQPLGSGAFCDGAPSENPFGDLSAEPEATRDAILCLVATELTQGATATTYAPRANVTRRQMSLFVQRLADLLDELETGAPELEELPTFDPAALSYSDVAAGSSGAEAIGRLSQAGIVGGFPDGTFRPNAFVSRRQMAAFINRLQDFLVGVPYQATGDFFDDDAADPGQANLNALASVGIFQGDGQGNVDPGGDLTRRQMALILLRHAQVHLDFESIEAPFEPSADPIVVAPAGTAVLTAVAGTPEDPANTADDRTYTATVTDADADYRITLFESDNVTRSSTGETFAEDAATNLADEGTVAARITSVNGTALATAASSVVAKPAAGKITFVVDGASVEEVTPVVYVDGGDDTRLELDAANRPVETYDVGGDVRYSALAAPTVAEGLAGIDEITNTTAQVNVGGVIAGAAVHVHVVPDTTAGAGAFNPDATPTVSATTDAEPLETGFQVNLTGLTPGTHYTVYVTQSVGDDTSPPSVARPLVTEQNAVTLAATATSDDGTSIIVDFAGPVSCGTPAAVQASGAGGGLPNAFTSCAQGSGPDLLVYQLSMPLILDGLIPYTADLVTGAAVSANGTKPPVAAQSIPVS